MVKVFVRITVVASVVCGLAFAVQAGASADTPREMRLLGRGLETMFDDRVISYNSPSRDSPTTVSGPLNSGTSTGSNQYYSVGNVINSGDFSNGNGVLSPKSGRAG
ncbi:hypothetical protein SAMN05421874_1323 [Nonomuraea maritima]|uniref:Uncharacterized protein n=1 Tax=Nonomuraea maritima TaxID=683260 RepID=A0A1G9NS20_9ACTN|nr:hypothetical protein [Nonomuraea maritima]SDL89164.1 hypothetical protein SAMN05421874_1323 [Nonomuraea maritima]